MATEPTDDAASGKYSADAAAEPTEELAPEELPLDEVSAVEAVDEVESYDTQEIVPIENLNAPPAMRARANLPDIGEITEEDRAFIHRVFNQVKDVDFRSAPPPPPRKNLAGLDKKMQFLRDRVRELERDLARVGWVWSIKQRQVDAVDQLLDAKESERAAAVERYATVRDQATRSAQAFRAEEARLNAVINEGVAANSQLQGELAALRQEMDAANEAWNMRLEQERDEKNALLADFRSKIETAQQVFNELRETSTRTIAESEARIAALTSELQTTQNDLTSARQQIDELNAGLAAADAKQVELIDQLAITTRDLESTRQALSERETQLASANDTSARVRGEFEAELARVKSELESQTSTMQAQLTDANRGIEELRATVSQRDKRLQELGDEAAQARNERESRAAELQGTIRERELAIEDAGRAQEALKLEIADRQKSLDDQRREIEGLKTDVATLQRQLDASESELRLVREGSSTAETKAADLASELMALREEQRFLRVDNDRMSRRLAEIDRNGVQAQPVENRSESGSSEIK